ncbi:Hypothetical protein PHPALM_343 [Phytophthora palmivora]|uniref:Transmembrane protein n=1 Tax=Phytophthora palmivora TaxID=4796 RepID=A0A2P4YV25_9STRA|nr:Hypothetical protein PHPALM_343 [Phytophthora palmivora]
MNRVASDPSVKHHSRPNRQTSAFSRVRQKLAASWYRCYIGHRSEYSVERLLAFRDYYKRTSIFRAISICALTPLPSLLTALAIDCVPIRPPSDGWKANYAVWIRLLLAMSCASMGIVLQVKGAIESGIISIVGGVKIALGTAICSVFTMILAAIWKFPTPFGYILIIGPYVLFFAIFTALAVGPNVLFRSPALREQLKTQLVIIINQGIVVGCYAVFSAVFNRLSGTQQAAFVFVMPMIKFVTKQNIVNTAESYYEYVAPLVVFSVDLFNMYYAAICMQTSKSWITTVIIMTADTFHLVGAVRAIFGRSKIMTNKVETSVVQQPETYLDELPRILQNMLKEMEGPSPTTVATIRILVPFPLPLSDESKLFLTELLKTNGTKSNHRRSKKCSKVGGETPTSGTMPTKAMLTQISPEILTTTFTGESRLGTKKRANAQVVQEALKTLFHSEYVMLSEYIEFVVPMLYAPYLAAIFHLPVAAYYPHTASMTTTELHSAISNIFLYAIIEFMIFAVLLVILKRKFGFSPLYQLAFVLETHAPALQGHLFVWTITILHLTLAHYGVDFNILTNGTF